jgi:hypothetical protein
LAGPYVLEVQVASFAAVILELHFTGMATTIMLSSYGIVLASFFLVLVLWPF